MIELPQELIYEIINHLPKYYPKCPRACSLVAKSWTRPSQEPLFEEVDIYERNLQPWLKNVSPTNVELLGHVRSLSYIMNAVSRKTEPPHRALRDYPPSFRQLRHLVLSAPVPLLPQRIEIFSAFQHTLLHISLPNSNITIGALITASPTSRVSISILSTMTRKTAQSLPFCDLPPKNCSSLSLPGTTWLFLTSYRNWGCGLTNLTSTRRDPPLYGRNSPSVSSTPSGPVPSDSDCLVLPTVRTFRLNHTVLNPDRNPIADVGDTFTLSHCRELREVEIFTSHPTKAVELSLIPSITSMNIQTIIFTCSSAHREFSVGRAYWKQLDQVLCKLADRPKYRHRLGVEFQSASNRWDEQPDLRKCLPRFHEKGRVRVVGLGGGLIYCSMG